MTLKMKYNETAVFQHPVTLPEFKLVRKQFDDACTTPLSMSGNRDINAIIMLANQLIPDRISEDGKNPNIIELDTVAEANKIDLSVYRWSERMSAKKGMYVFVLRQNKRDK